MIQKRRIWVSHILKRQFNCGINPDFLDYLFMFRNPMYPIS